MFHNDWLMSHEKSHTKSAEFECLTYCSHLCTLVACEVLPETSMYFLVLQVHRSITMYQEKSIFGIQRNENFIMKTCTSLDKEKFQRRKRDVCLLLDSKLKIQALSPLLKSNPSLLHVAISISVKTKVTWSNLSPLQLRNNAKWIFFSNTFSPFWLPTVCIILNNSGEWINKQPVISISPQALSLCFRNVALQNREWNLIKETGV